jgi:HEAT repeat protein
MIALVNDSGVGKTSLVCSFAESLRQVVPVVLAQARNLAFSDEHALVTHVIHALQGVLDPSVRAREEVALVHHLEVGAPLTVIVDGLDETHAPDAVGKAITCWLQSRLGEIGILIVTSRLEFWRTCSDQYWGRWMPKTVTDERSALPAEESLGIERRGPDAGLPLPARFTESELEASWVKAGRQRAELHTLSPQVREELLHPFTLRVYLDLCAQEGAPPPIMAQMYLIERWLNRRLEIEALQTERTTRDLFHQALRTVATTIASTNSGAVSVDELGAVPRFNPSHPPGPVVQRLIEANILETLPGHADCIRFTIETVQDFYLAEADIEDIKADALAAARRFAGLRFTEAYPRLTRIGRRLGTDEVRHLFAERMTEMDARTGAVVLATDPSQYTPELRAKVAQHLGCDICGRHRVQAAFAITMLGGLDCPESVDVLMRYLLPPANPHKYLKRIGATAFVKLGHPETAEFVFRWERFGVFQGNDTYYDREQLATLRRAKPGFRHALAEHAAKYLDSPSGDPMHARAVYVLASLGDERLIEHLRDRLKTNGLLHNYENHALVAIGTDGAGSVFSESVIAVGQRLAKLPNNAENNRSRHDLIWPIQFVKPDIRYLVTPAFAHHLQPLIKANNSDVSWIVSDLVKRSGTASLLYHVAEASARQNRWFDSFPAFGERSAVTPELWLDWWRKTTDPSVQMKLLCLTPLCPSVDVEEVLLRCLDVDNLRARAAGQLSEYGAVRAAPHLRQILAENTDEHTIWAQIELARALGNLRDEAAIPSLKAMISAHPKSDAAAFAIASLGAIGTSEAETALHELLAEGVREDPIASALINCGSPSAMASVIARAKTKPDRPEWLCERAGYLSWARGWTRGRYYKHISTTDFVQYVDTMYQAKCAEWDSNLIHVFGQIDSPDIRCLLRKWVKRLGTPEDATVRENDRLPMLRLYIQELTDRGDEFAIPYALNLHTDEKDSTYVHFAADALQHFPSSAVAAEISSRLLAATTESGMVRMISLLGRFGSASDKGLVSLFIDHRDDLVANVAYESLLRLTDPLLVPEGWREV